MIKFHIAAFFITCSSISCGTSKIDRTAKYQVNFLDEYIYESQNKFDEIEIGGLSGIDYDGNNFVLISDKSKSPEIYTVDIQIEAQSIRSIEFKNLKKLRCEGVKAFDSESIRNLPHKTGYLVSTEGNINAEVSPAIIEIDSVGVCQKTYNLPKHFKLTPPNRPRQNGVFEGLTVDQSHEGFWVVNEIPLVDDGKKPKLINTNSPVRLTHYQFQDREPNYQLSYDLDRLIKIPFLPFGLNGVTEILQIDKNHILVLERAYSAGHKSKGNRVKLFLIDISNSQNTLNIKSLKKHKHSNVKKVLLFDSKKIKKKLEFKFIDNIEGISFGPVLSNGNKSLILVSDNNFNALGQQLNQFLLLELIISTSL